MPKPPKFSKIVRAKRYSSLGLMPHAKLGVPYRTMEDWEAGKHTPRGIAHRLIVEKLARLK
jgi:DNA-binding transcriptional regulator YiaG